MKERRHRQKRHRIAAELWRWLRRGLLIFVALTVMAVGVFRFVAPPSTWLISTERARLGKISWTWTPDERLGLPVKLAAIGAEDSRFCAHYGIDFLALREAFESNLAGNRLRGGSTITQQVAKNLFLWPARSWLRKGLEAWFALWIEILWPKKRILEIYLNIAEFGPGRFGASAAARKEYNIPPAELSKRQAARIIAVLPSPRKLRARSRRSAHRRRVARILAEMKYLEKSGTASCIF